MFLSLPHLKHICDFNNLLPIFSKTNNDIIIGGRENEIQKVIMVFEAHPRLGIIVGRWYTMFLLLIYYQGLSHGVIRSSAINDKLSSVEGQSKARNVDTKYIISNITTTYSLQSFINVIVGLKHTVIKFCSSLCTIFQPTAFIKYVTVIPRECASLKQARHLIASFTSHLWGRAACRAT